MKIIKIINKFFNSPWLIVVICFMLGTIPLFWFKPGYMDLGGDSSRLYFYDPIHFIRSFVLDIFLPDSLGISGGQTYLLPFTLFLELLHVILKSPYLVIVIFDGLSIITAFLAVYRTTLEFIGKNTQNKHTQDVRFAAIITGLFYTFIPISSMSGWDIPLIIHTQRFVYPLIFWCLLRYIHTLRTYYLLIAVFVSFVFAQNFSWVALPNMLSFFFTSCLFLAIYIWVRKTKISFKAILCAAILFLFIHAFQYLPLLSNVFEQNNAVSNQLSQGNGLTDTLHYIDSVASYTVRGYQLIGLTPFSNPIPLNMTLIIFPILIVWMLIKNKNIFILLPASFFLILYFIVTAHITKFGFALFKSFFILPGFIMFRDFYGRWDGIYLLFYSLMVGFALLSVLTAIKGYKKFFFLLSLVIILSINALPFLDGQISNRILTKDTGIVVRSSLRIDPQFEKVLQHMRNDLSIGRNLTLPIADFDYELIPGMGDDGAYFGPSIIAYLTGKNDLASSFTLRPFTTALYDSAKRKEFTTFSNIFPLLGIRTVFYNADPYIYDVFATFPYFDSKLYMPKTQKEYLPFINSLPISKQEDFGKKFHVYTVKSSDYVPPIYIAKQAVLFNQNISSKGSNYDEKIFRIADYVLKHFREDKGDTELRKVFLDKSVHAPSFSVPRIQFSQVNPSKYIISVTGANNPYMIVFSQSFNQNWKLFLASEQTARDEKYKNSVGKYFDNSIIEKESENAIIDMHAFETIGKKPIADAHHYLANAYANAWHIKPNDVEKKNTYTLILEMTDQRSIYAGFLISFIGLSILFIWLGRDIIVRR